MNTALQSTHDLLSGQSTHLRLERGDVVVVTRGSVVLCPAAQWIAECMVATPRQLEEGAQLRIDAAGWVALAAQSTAACVQIAPRRPAPRRQWLPDWARRLAF